MDSLYQFLWIFFIYAFLGWCLEVSFFALSSGKFVNRGFLNGPVCPIYGFGVVIVALCLTPLMGSTLLLFLGSVALTSLLELAVGFVLEKLFHQRWWDYTNEPFNLEGYICLRFSLAWGVACLLVMKVIHPSILFLIQHVPHTLGVALLCIFAAVMAADLAATVRTIARINRSLGQIDELAAKIKAASNELGENLADRVLDAAEKGADWKEILSDRTEDLMDNFVELRENLTDKTEDLMENLADWKESLSDKTEDLMENLAGWKENMSEQREEYQMEQALRKAQRQQELEELKQKLNELLDRRTFGQRRLLRAFPHMRSINHTQALERLRQRQQHKPKVKTK